MEIFARLKDWFSQSGAPWRAYPAAASSPDLTLALPGGVSQASSVRTEGRRRSLREVAVNVGTQRESALPQA